MTEVNGSNAAFNISACLDTTQNTATLCANPIRSKYYFLVFQRSAFCFQEDLGTNLNALGLCLSKLRLYRRKKLSIQQTYRAPPSKGPDLVYL